MGFTSVADYVAGKMDWLLNGLPVEGELATLARAIDVAEDIATCDPQEEVAKVRDRVGDQPCVVVNDARVVLGLFGPSLETREGPVVDVMHPAPLTFRAGVPAAELASHLGERELGSALLTTAEGRLVGIVRAERLDAVSR